MMSEQVLQQDNSFKAKLKSFSIYLISGIGALGVALQNYMAVASLLTSIVTLAKNSVGVLHAIAVALGGLCSGTVNFFINIGLLKKFFARFTDKKPRPKLTGWRKFSYYAGSAIFITTGILFGLTAFAFGPIGVLGAVAIAAGIAVAIISMISELETWLQRFDEQQVIAESEHQEIIKKKNLLQRLLDSIKNLPKRLVEWKNSLTKGNVIGTFITIVNVVALSLLMTLGVAAFLSGVGVPALPALITALALGFTVGAFTEFYFYHGFLSNFCDNLKEKWAAFKASKWPALGLICSTTNALVNGALVYVGVTMIAGLLAAASVAVPPIGVIIAVAVVLAIAAAAASFILGLDFWTDNMKKKEVENTSTETFEEPESEDFQPESTAALAKIFKEEPVPDNTASDAIPAIEPVTTLGHAVTPKVSHFSFLTSTDNTDACRLSADYQHTSSRGLSAGSLY